MNNTVLNSIAPIREKRPNGLHAVQNRVLSHSLRSEKYIACAIYFSERYKPPTPKSPVIRPLGAPLLGLLLALGGLGLGGWSEARVRLGEPLPPHPWTESAPRELIVIYSHDCGDVRAVWDAALRSGLPVRAVNAEEVAWPAPKGVAVWRGPDATAFARALRVGAYPTVLLVQDGRIFGAWEGEAELGEKATQTWTPRAP